MIVVVPLPAERGTRYAPGALDSNIGKRFPRIYNGQPATLTAVEVVDGGRAALLTLDLGDQWQDMDRRPGCRGSASRSRRP